MVISLELSNAVSSDEWEEPDAFELDELDS